MTGRQEAQVLRCERRRAETPDPVDLAKSGPSVLVPEPLRRELQVGLPEASNKLASVIVRKYSPRDARVGRPRHTLCE